MLPPNPYFNGYVPNYGGSRQKKSRRHAFVGMQAKNPTEHHSESQDEHKESAQHLEFIFFAGEFRLDLRYNVCFSRVYKIAIAEPANNRLRPNFFRAERAFLKFGSGYLLNHDGPPADQFQIVLDYS
jgi:hypothetical protein